MGFLLFIIAFVFTVIITIIWFPINILWHIVTFKWKKATKLLDDWFYYQAELIDVYSNHSLSTFFNRTMIKGKDKFQFTGTDRDTISYTIAKNRETKTLTIFGRFWGKLLDKIEKDHLKKALINKEKRDLKGIKRLEDLGYKITITPPDYGQ